MKPEMTNNQAHLSLILKTQEPTITYEEENWTGVMLIPLVVFNITTFLPLDNSDYNTLA